MIVEGQSRSKREKGNIW